MMLELEIKVLTESALLRAELLEMELETGVTLEKGVLLGTSTWYEDKIGVELDAGTMFDEVCSTTKEAVLNVDVV